MRLAARVDANSPQIVRVFRDLGCTWQPLHQVPGALDGILGCSGVDQRVEIKDGSKEPARRKLTPAERKVFAEWRGRAPVVVETEEQALALVQAIRSAALAS